MDLSTRYLGLRLDCPIVAGAGPLTGDIDNLRRLEDFGAGAVVLPSIFEEQIEHEQDLIEQLTSAGIESYAEALTYFPAASAYRIGPGRYLELVRKAADSLHVPVIASLNGITGAGWIEYARQIEEAGASALELNVYFIPADPGLSGQEVERRYVAILETVKQAVGIPVAVKLGPYFSSMGHMAGQLVAAGADGLVLFNRFYQPDIDLTTLALSPSLELSGAAEIRLPLLWIGVLSGRIRASLAAATGVETTDEVLKYLYAGADVAMTTSALLRHGVGHMRALVGGLRDWLAARDLDAVDRIRGRMSQANIDDPTAFERANYIHILQGYRASR
jgi:dihydroorotate dehydrogenase (fumarate)